MNIKLFIHLIMDLLLFYHFLFINLHFIVTVYCRLTNPNQKRPCGHSALALRVSAKQSIKYRCILLKKMASSAAALPASFPRHDVAG